MARICLLGDSLACAAPTPGAGVCEQAEVCANVPGEEQCAYDICESSSPSCTQTITVLPLGDPACNEPPVCNARGPYTEECTGATTSVLLDGSGSSDPDGDTLTYAWSTNCSGGSLE